MFLSDHPPFRVSALMQNSFVQTIAGGLRRCPRRESLNLRSYAVRMRDGDRLAIHDGIGEGWITGDRVVVLFHGLVGSHMSPYVSRTAGKLMRAGLRTVLVDMRGWGDSRWLSRGHFTGASSNDVADVIEAVRLLSPLSRITPVGFSLGGQVVLRMLGEPGAKVPDEVDSAIAVAPPIDLLWCSANLRHWGNRIYDHFFTNRIVARLMERRRKVPGLIDNRLQKMPVRLLHLDDQFTAPVHGFSGARQYYRMASSAPLLTNIQTPVLIVAAEDDPVIPVEMFRQWPMSTSVEVIRTRHGGHIGFLGNNRRDPDSSWLDWRLVQWILSLDRQNNR